MKLNRPQKGAVMVMLPLFLLAVIFPPWDDFYFDRVVFAPIWETPGKAILHVRLILYEWAVIYVLLVIILFSLRTRKNQ